MHFIAGSYKSIEILLLHKLPDICAIDLHEVNTRWQISHIYLHLRCVIIMSKKGLAEEVGDGDLGDFICRGDCKGC